MPILLKDLTVEQLHASLTHFGVTLRMARQLHGAIVLHGGFPQALPEVSPKVLDQIRGLAEVPHLTLVEKAVSSRDEFAKYLFGSTDGATFEAVRIPLMHRPEDRKYIVCVSSQVGCAMGCEFCATARIGFRRHLAPWEIVDQVIKIRDESPFPVRGVVFMGMGEPLLNYDAVMRAARILTEPAGLAIAGKAITISTVGIVPGIRRFTADRRRYRLVVSLTTADPVRRRELMPVEQAFSTAELMQALREYHAATRRRVTLAWIMMAGVNTSEHDARQLAELTRGLPVMLDLIDVNDPTGRFRPPTREELSVFRDALTAHLGVPVARRYSGGSDIHAACGMLAGRHVQPAGSRTADQPEPFDLPSRAEE